MTELLYFEDLKIGQSWKTADRTVSEADVLGFAELTGDHDPLHVDPEFAKQTPFGRQIAHGLFGLSLVAGLGIECPKICTIAFVSIMEWKFLKPIFFGDSVHAVAEVVEKRPSGRRRGVVIWKRQLINQDGVVVQEGILETLVALAKPVAAAKIASSSQQ